MKNIYMMALVVLLTGCATSMTQQQINDITSGLLEDISSSTIEVQEPVTFEQTPNNDTGKTLKELALEQRR